MSILVEHKIHDCSTETYHGCSRQGKCEDDCPRCAQDKIVALIKQKRDALKDIPGCHIRYSGEIELLDELLKELEA